MKAAAMNRTFSDWLKYWSWRGGMLALPSGFYAGMLGYQSLSAVLGMLAGIGFWLVAYSRVTSSDWFYGQIQRSRLWRRLSWVIWAKVLVPVVAGIGLVFPPLMALMIPDFYTGVFTVHLTRTLGGAAFDLNSTQSWSPTFGGTFLTTVLQGGLVSLQVLLLAAVACVFPPFQKHKPIVSGEEATSAGGNESM